MTGLKDYYPAAESKLTNNKPFKGPPHADNAYLDSIKTALSQEGFTVCSPDGLPEWAHLAAEFKSDLDYSFPMGAYSTADEILDLVYNHNEYLVVLLDVQALYVSEEGDVASVHACSSGESCHCR